MICIFMVKMSFNLALFVSISFMNLKNIYIEYDIQQNLIQSHWKSYKFLVLNHFSTDIF